MEEKIKLANMFYNFVSEFKKDTKTTNDDNDPLKTVKNLVEEFYVRDSMYFILKKDKDVAITQILEMLSCESGTLHLLNKLELTFDDPDDYINQIENLEYITKGFVNKKQFKTIINRNFKYDDDFKKLDYLKLYYDYKNLRNKLMTYKNNFNKLYLY